MSSPAGFYWVMLDGEWIVAQKRNGYWGIVGTTKPFSGSEFQKDRPAGLHWGAL